MYDITLWTDIAVVASVTLAWVLLFVAMGLAALIAYIIH